MSRVPDLAPFQLMNLANNIYTIRQKVCDAVLAKRYGTISLRDTLTSSKIRQILAKSGYSVQIGDLKALLKELGFNWNGPACSFTQFFSKLKEYLNP
jgi:transposase